MIALLIFNSWLDKATVNGSLFHKYTEMINTMQTADNNKCVPQVKSGCQYYDFPKQVKNNMKY